jgi:hypothetical protein
VSRRFHVSYVAGMMLAGYAVLWTLGRQAGSTRPERRAQLPGDDLVARPLARTDHAITVNAPPEAIWPWLTQMGWHRAGYYTPRWVDQVFFPQNWPSLTHLDPALVRDLSTGDTIPDGPPGTAWYVVTQSDPPRSLVLRSTTHLPPGWQQKFGARIDWTWSFQLTRLPRDQTRLQLRMRGRLSPWWLAMGYLGAVVPADYVMAQGMLHGIKQRAETRAQIPD